MPEECVAALCFYYKAAVKRLEEEYTTWEASKSTGSTKRFVEPLKSLKPPVDHL